MRVIQHDSDSGGGFTVSGDRFIVDFGDLAPLTGPLSSTFVTRDGMTATRIYSATHGWLVAVPLTADKD